MISEQNAYFARATVNRVWGQFFGIGIVNPVDDFTAANPPSHPELLDELARQFVAHKYDFKFLIRAITASPDFHQLNGLETDKSQENPRLFARMALKGLSAEQLFDSISQATGFHETFSNRNALGMMNSTPRRIRAAYSKTTATRSPNGKTTESCRALSMMNGQFVTDATGLGELGARSRLVAAISA